MSTLLRRIAAAVTLALLLLATLELSASAAAAQDRYFTLYGDRDMGWGETDTTLRSPGPEISVEVGDNVTLNLTSLDGRTRRWYVDYNGDTTEDANENLSNSFGTAVEFTFIVSNVTGTFRYRSSSNGDESVGLMWGNITIRNATAGGPFGLDSTALALVGGIVLALVIIGVAVLVRRRTREPELPPPPPPPDE